MWSEDRLAAGSFGRTAIGDGAAEAEGTSGGQADGDARLGPVRYGLDRDGGVDVGATRSLRAAGVEESHRGVPCRSRGDDALLLLLVALRFRITPQKIESVPRHSNQQHPYPQS